MRCPLPEFTIAKYVARPNSIGSGYKRGVDHCIVSLLHPALATQSAKEVEAHYDSKRVAEGAAADLWGGELELSFSDRLNMLNGEYNGGVRVYAWVGREMPGCNLVRVLRGLWPYPVDSCAVLQNTVPNPELDRAKMRLLMAVSQIESGTAGEMALQSVHMGGRQQPALLAADANRNNIGVLVRLKSQHYGTEDYVRLRVLPENFVPLKSQLQINYKEHVRYAAGSW